MNNATADGKVPLGHLELEMLHETLLEWCGERNLHPQSEQGRDTAKELVELFDIGIRDRNELREAIVSK
jgi:hypothetical protein